MLSASFPAMPRYQPFWRSLFRDDHTGAGSSSRVVFFLTSMTLCGCLIAIVALKAKGLGGAWDGILNSITICIAAATVPMALKLFKGGKDEPSE